MSETSNSKKDTVAYDNVMTKCSEYEIFDNAIRRFHPDIDTARKMFSVCCSQKVARQQLIKKVLRVESNIKCLEDMKKDYVKFARFHIK